MVASSRSYTGEIRVEPPGLDNEIVEVSLLLPRWQIQAMDTAARQRGMNLAQMLRRMIGATFAPQPPIR